MRWRFELSLSARFRGDASFGAGRRALVPPIRRQALLARTLPPLSLSQVLNARGRCRGKSTWYQGRDPPHSSGGPAGRFAHRAAPLSLTRRSKGVRSSEALEILRRATGGGPKPARLSEPPAAALAAPPELPVLPGAATVAALDRPPAAFFVGLVPWALRVRFPARGRRTGCVGDAVETVKVGERISGCFPAPFIGRR